VQILQVLECFCKHLKTDACAQQDVLVLLALDVALGLLTVAEAQRNLSVGIGGNDDMRQLLGETDVFGYVDEGL
jgi:hypothetical protein